VIFRVCQFQQRSLLLLLVRLQIYHCIQLNATVFGVTLTGFLS